MKPFVYEIHDLQVVDAFMAVKHMPYSLLLDSADRNHPAGRYSFMMCQPIETIKAKDGVATITNWEQKLSFTGDPFEILRDRMQSWVRGVSAIPNLPPFQGGAAGLFAYDLGRVLEDIPDTAREKMRAADMDIGIYDQVIARDHLLKKTYVFTHARSEDEAVRKREYLLEMVTQKIAPAPYEPCDLDWYTNFSAQEYQAAVRKVIDYIHAGDIFQANLAQRFSATLPQGFDAFVHYLHLREYNPAPFAAYMNLGDVKISSASPERFIQVRGGQVETSPIKGTRPRYDNVAQDRASKQELQNSAKDRAENTMIVDLLRNDLSRVCEANSIEVKDLCKLESFTSVHHLVSTIRGALRAGKDGLDVLRACFPGGSITGAPKIRAMEIIEEIEGVRRGAYCGAVGYVGFDGAMDTNILIRTLCYEGDQVYLHAGGGIVAESDPAAEYEETLDKAVRVLTSFETKAGMEKKHGALAS